MPPAVQDSSPVSPRGEVVHTLMLSSSVTQEGSYASHYAWVLLRPISPHLSMGQRCISYYYFQTFAYQCRFASPVRPDCVVLTCYSLNHDSSTQTIRNGLSDGPLSRRRGQSLHAELNLVGSITLPDISYRRFYRRLPFGISRQALFFSFSDIKPHGLDESFSCLLGLFQVFLLNTISQYSLEGHLKITLLLYSQTLPFLKPFLENFLKKIKSL